MEMKPSRSIMEQKRVARRLASGQGDLIYATTLIVLLIAILRALFSSAQYRGQF